MRIADLSPERRELWLRMMLHTSALRIRLPVPKAVVYFKPPRAYGRKRFRILGVKP